jgi:23S rRNA (pseudouridine1915-N3)-methyltransferase
MKLTLLCVGKLRGPLAEVVEEYEKRVARYHSFDVVEVRESTHRGQTAAQVVEDEGARLLARLPPRGELLALHRPGSQMSSEQLAEYLAEAALRSLPAVTFVIGGAYGLSRQVLERADRLVSLSSMTLPHEIARLLLTEQLYRAGTIARGEPYHKGPKG